MISKAEQKKCNMEMDVNIYTYWKLVADDEYGIWFTAGTEPPVPLYLFDHSILKCAPSV